MSEHKRQDRSVATRPASYDPIAVRLEVVLYGALVLLALALRLLRLDWLPLSEAEAALALPSWQAARAEAAVSVPGEPLLFHALRLVFWLLGGGSDVTARLVPAVAGVLAVAFTWRLRDLLGRTTALTLAGLLAASPVWVFVGRQVSGLAISLAAVVLLVGTLSASRPVDRLLLPAAAGLALVAGNLVYGLLLALLLYGVLVALRGELRDHQAIIGGLWPEKADRQAAIAVFVGTIVLAATGLLSQPNGFAALVEAPARWANNLVTGPRGFGQWLLLPGLAYAPVTFTFGLVGLVLAARRLRRLDMLILLWTVVALAIALAARSPAGMLELLLPVTIGAAVAIAALLEEIAERFQWHEDGVMVGILLTVLGFGLVQAFSHCHQGASTSERLIVGSLLLAAGLLVAYAFLWGFGLARRVLGITALIALSTLAWANGTPLDYRGGLVVRELLHTEFVTSDTARLAHTLSMASWAETRDPDALETLVDPSLRPQLAWHFRHRQAVAWREAAKDVSLGALVVPAGTESAPAVSGSYRGTRFAIAGQWQPQLGTLQSFLRWYLQRRSPAGSSQAGDIAYDQVELYLKTE